MKKSEHSKGGVLANLSKFAFIIIILLVAVLSVKQVSRFTPPEESTPETPNNTSSSANAPHTTGEQTPSIGTTPPAVTTASPKPSDERPTPLPPFLRLSPARRSPQQHPPFRSLRIRRRVESACPILPMKK